MTISIVAMLVVLLLPSLAQSRATARTALCATNLHSIHGSIVGNGFVGESPMPAAGAWPARVLENAGGIDVLVCPEDDEERNPVQSIGGWYVFQDGNQNWDDKGAFLTDIGPGTTWTQYQSEAHRIIGRSGPNEYNGVWEGHYAWPEDPQYGYSGEIQPGDFEVGFEDDAGTVIESDGAGGFQAVMVFGPENVGGGSSNSRHWLAFDADGDRVLTVAEAEEEQQYWMSGKNHQNRAEFPSTHPLSGVSGSYGMNSMAGPAMPDASQLLMLDYKKNVADYSGSDDDVFDEWYAPRHRGQSNVLRGDGSVQLMSRSQVDPTLRYDFWE